MLKDLKEILKGHPRLFFAVVAAAIIGVFASTCASMVQCASTTIEITDGGNSSEERVLEGEDQNSNQTQKEVGTEQSEQPNSSPS